MKSLILVLGLAAAAAVVQAQSAPTAAGTVGTVSKGQLVVTANGARLGVVYRVSPDGSPQIIIDGKLVTIPAATLSSSAGKLVTSLSKVEVSELH
ncbi:MAG: hypothetical protein ACLPV8_12510 [Steroidobacteraceae bacterium]